MDNPVEQPILTNVLIEAIHAANEEAGQKEKAFDTPFRYSDAGKCGRQMAFASLGYERTEPVDLAGEHVMWLGTLMHEKLQEALRAKYPDAEIEGKSSLHDLTSGHFDALLTFPDGRRCLYELKTKGTYGFDLAVGILRKQWKRAEPEGPGIGAKIQGALNAIAVGADLLVIGLIGFEAISKGFAEKIACSEEDRIMAEWHYDRETFEPWALAELERLRDLADVLDHETLPARWGLDDDMAHVEFNPDLAKPPWNCQYCSWKSLCQFAGPRPGCPAHPWNEGDPMTSTPLFDPAERVEQIRRLNPDEILATQLEQLFKPLNPVRVAKREGMSYLEAWDVIAHLTRIFGPLNWDKEVVRESLIYDDYVTWTPRGGGSDKSGWDVAYRATVRLTVRTALGTKVSEDVATGQAQHQPSRGDAHDLALKSAVSDALKRAAKDLGNQMGLSLYDSGSVKSVVGSSLAHPGLSGAGE